MGVAVSGESMAAETRYIARPTMERAILLLARSCLIQMLRAIGAWAQHTLPYKR